MKRYRRYATMIYSTQWQQQNESIYVKSDIQHKANAGMTKFSQYLTTIPLLYCATSSYLLSLLMPVTV